MREVKTDQRELDVGRLEPKYLHLAKCYALVFFLTLP